MKFEVFVSFRGTDTRRTFVSHLLLSLFKKHIRTFKCEEEFIPLNQPASSQALEAIENSKIAIVVISKNYTASISCLEELAMIIECKERGSMVVIPVLYELDPSDVLRQADDFVGGGNNNNLEKVKRWKDALAKAIQIYHQDYSHWKDDEDSYSYIIDRVMIFVFKCLIGPLVPCSLVETSEPSIRRYGGYRSDSFQTSEVHRVDENLVECSAECSYDFKIYRRFLLIPIEIVITMGFGFVRGALRTIAGIFLDGGKRSSSVKPRPEAPAWSLQKDDKFVLGNDLSWFVRSSNDFDSFVGMDRHTKAVQEMLDLQMSDAVGEIGICGVKGVGKTTVARCVYEQISPQFQDHYYYIKDSKSYSTCLLEEITRAALMPTSSDSESLYEVVKTKLGHRKVLLIVDDDELQPISQLQLENVLKVSSWFGPGSRFIFIGERKKLLRKCRVRRIYEVESMRYDEALQLFSQFAFKQEHVPRYFYKVSVRAVLVTCRIPLALKVFGSFLRGKSINEWEVALCRLEALYDDCVAGVSSYIGEAFS